MAYKKWLVAAADKNKASELSELCDTDPFLTYIALSRGYTTPYELEMFFTSEPVLTSPYELPNIAKAAQAVNDAISENKKFAVFGDYDCDGITSTALFYGYLKERGADAIYYLPDRFSDGYGMNNSAIDKLKADNVELIITVDNGISAKNEVEYAKSLGIDVIITDHHLPPAELPDALAVVNPHLPECVSKFKDISGVAVAFKTVCAIEGAEPEELLHKYADLLAIGLIADVMPLKNENRCIVKEGIKAINNTRKAGITALLNTAAICRGSVNARRVAFGIAPRINAAGRMSTPISALELLLCNDFNKACKLALIIEEENRKRREEEAVVFAEAVKQIEQNGYNYNRVIVAAGKNWHNGVLGIAAAKITEKYGKPAILLSVNEDFATGSGRSIEDFSLYDCLKSCEDLLEKFGGHTLAAGLSLKTENIDLLRERLNEYAYLKPLATPVLNLDCKLNISGITLDLAEAIEELEPFGAGNPVPVFGIYNLKIVRISELSEGKHLRLLLSRDGNSIQVMLFGVSANAFPFSVDDTVDLAVTLGVNEYNGKKNVSVVAKGIKKSGLNDDTVLSEYALYDSFKCGKTGKYPNITRDEIGLIYKAAGKCATEEKLRQLFINLLGVFKTSAAIDVLTELGLILKREVGNITFISLANGKKVNLENSETYRKLKG